MHWLLPSLENFEVFHFCHGFAPYAAPKRYQLLPTLRPRRGLMIKRKTLQPGFELVTQFAGRWVRSDVTRLTPSGAFRSRTKKRSASSSPSVLNERLVQIIDAAFSCVTGRQVTGKKNGARDKGHLRHESGPRP
jgi:hypothetical protein